MRNEQEMMVLFEEIIWNDDRIRLAVLEGSRTNKNIPKDDFQDYDITFFVTDMDFYKQQDRWLAQFGELIFMQKPENMTLFEPELGNWFSYLMYFRDGVKIDLTLIPIEEVELYFEKSDGLVEILIDKDNRIKIPIVPTDKKYWIQKPTEAEFIDCCNEFWHVTAYVAKGLYRKEILFALDHLNNIIRPELLRMMAWEIGSREGFTFSLGKNYKFIDRYVNEEEFTSLLKTFSLNGYEEAWDSLSLCCDLFRNYSKKVAAAFGFSYPPYGEVMTDFIYHVYGKINRTSN